MVFSYILYKPSFYVEFGLRSSCPHVRLRLKKQSHMRGCVSSHTCTLLNIRNINTRDNLEVLKMGDPQFTKGFNTMSWSHDLDGLGYPHFRKPPSFTHFVDRFFFSTCAWWSSCRLRSKWKSDPPPFQRACNPRSSESFLSHEKWTCCFGFFRPH